MNAVTQWGDFSSEKDRCNEKGSHTHIAVHANRSHVRSVGDHLSAETCQFQYGGQFLRRVPPSTGAEYDSTRSSTTTQRPPAQTENRRQAALWTFALTMSDRLRDWRRDLDRSQRLALLLPSFCGACVLYTAGALCCTDLLYVVFSACACWGKLQLPYS